MATRQNKKRKGRQNVNNRERTVTTLTEDPATAFLIPTPSEVSPTAHSIPSHYAGSSNSNSNNNNNNTAQNQQPHSQLEARNQAFSAFPSYNNSSSYLGPMLNPNFSATPGTQQKQQDDHQYLPYPVSSNLPPGQSDLEVLEKLKESIKNGQHQFYRAVPQPNALTKVYLGSASSPYESPMTSKVVPHPEQVPPTRNGASLSPTGNAPASSGPTESSGDYSRRTRNQSMSMDSWDGSTPRNKPASSPPNYPIPPSQPQARGTDGFNNGSNVKSFPPSGPSAGPKGHNDMRGSVDLKSSSNARDAPSDLGPRGSLGRPPVQSPASSRLDQQQIGRSVGDFNFGHKGSADPKSSSDGKDDVRQRETWLQRPIQASQDEKLSKPLLDPSDRSPRSGGLDPGRPSDRGYFDRDRERDRDRDRERDTYTDRSRERRYERLDRRMDDRPRIIDNRRPPSGHWESSRRPYEHTTIIDKRLDSDPTRAIADRHSGVSDDRSRPLDDRIPSARVPESRNEAADDRRTPLPSISTLGNDVRRPPLGPSLSTEERNSRQTASGIPSTSAATAEESIARNTSEDRAMRPQPPPGPKEDRKVVSLEERLSRAAPPSLQDRLSQPQVSETRASTRPPPVGPSLEERLSQPANIQDNVRGGRVPATPDDRNNRQVPGLSAANDRMTRPNDNRSRTVAGGGASPDGRHPAAVASRPLAEERARPIERYPPPMTSVEDRKGLGSAPPPRPHLYTQSSSTSNARAQSVNRDEVSIRDYRSGGPGVARAMSVSREPPVAAADLRPSVHRPDPDRYGERRTDLIDNDRYTDNRSQPSYRSTPSVPPQHQHQSADSRERGVWDRQRWPSPPARNDPYAEDARFRAPYQQGQWVDYDNRPRSWEEKDRQWEQNDGWPDRRFVERDAVATGGTTGWETRQEREQREQREREQRRPTFGPGERPATGGYDSRPLSSRLTDAYAPPEDRNYASDLDASGMYPPSTTVGGGADAANSPPYSRIRQRSSSPTRDMSRPPTKRPRGEYDAAHNYYSPHTPGAVAAADFAPRMTSPAPSVPASGYYDRPPPHDRVYTGTASSGGAGVARDRVYSGSREGYQPSSAYDRTYRVRPPRSHQFYQGGDYPVGDHRI